MKRVILRVPDLTAEAVAVKARLESLRTGSDVSRQAVYIRLLRLGIDTELDTDLEWVTAVDKAKEKLQKETTGDGR